MQYQALYISMRGSDSFWEVITNHTPLHYALMAEEVKLIINTMANARNDYRGTEPVTPMNELVTRFIELGQHTAALPPPQTFTLSVRPSAAAVAAAESSRIVAGLASNMNAMNIASNWPPSHFTPTDLIILADSEVAAALGGVDANNNSPRQPFTLADSRNKPTLLRLHLCYLSLTQYKAPTDWALSLSPVGFLHDIDRRKWFAVAGRQTKVFTTLPRFLSYAFDALMNRHKTFAVGMFAHWLLQSRNVEKVADLVRNDPEELWTDREMMRRYATVVIIRSIPAGPSGNKRVHIIWYDPWLRDAAIKKLFAHSQHAVTNYRNEVAEAMKQWAVENDIEIGARYYGGPVSQDSALAGDSVKQCFAYLETLVSGRKNMGDALRYPTRRIRRRLRGSDMFSQTEGPSRHEIVGRGADFQRALKVPETNIRTCRDNAMAAHRQ
jgi:hypothetical protein